jgi:hypothetical protein
MRPAHPERVHQRFLAVCQRGLAKAEREERTHLAALRPKARDRARFALGPPTVRRR